MKYLTLLILFCLHGSAASLLVLKDGSSIVVGKVSKKGQSIHYTDKSGKPGDIAVEKLYIILPKVTRGQNYKPETISKVIAMVKKTRAAYPKLKKQTKILLDEWMALRNQLAELTPGAKKDMEAKIKKLIEEYEGGKKGRTELNGFLRDMNMIQYKDLRGVFYEQIQKALNKYKTEFVTKELARVKLKEKISIKEFLIIKETLSGLIFLKPSLKLKGEIKNRFKTARENCLKPALQKVVKSFAAKPSLGLYLKANSYLHKLSDQVADEAWKDKISLTRKSLQKKLPAYDFRVPGFENYPLTKKDKAGLEPMKAYLPSALNETAKALVLPVKKPAAVGLAKAYELDIKVIFRMDPPKNLGYSLKPFGIFYRPGRPIPLKNGRASFTLFFDFHRRPDAFKKDFHKNCYDGKAGKFMKVYIVRWYFDKSNMIQTDTLSEALHLPVK